MKLKAVRRDAFEAYRMFLRDEIEATGNYNEESGLSLVLRAVWESSSPPESYYIAEIYKKGVFSIKCIDEITIPYREELERTPFMAVLDKAIRDAEYVNRCVQDDLYSKKGWFHRWKGR